MKEKEVLNAEKVREKIRKADAKALAKMFKDKAFKKYKTEIANKWAPLILKNDKPTHSLTYDSFSEGLEPIYFWILDFMKDPAPGGLGLTVHKGAEDLEASTSSGYFGEQGARTTQMQKNAMEYMGAINQVIKSIVNLLYDLKEFEIRLDAYDKINSKDEQKIKEGELVLRGVWMDQVDIKRGKGSLNMLAQDLKFITIRDAFFIVKDTKDVDNLDLNERVKRILTQRMSEYETWKQTSEREIRQRYNIEKSYLKQQVGALKLYVNWAKPYLKAAEKLRMKEFNTAHIVNSFSNIEMDLNLWGYQEIKPKAVSEKFKDIKLDTKYFAAVAVNLHFRSVPQALQGQGGRHYIHGGRVEMKFYNYVLTSEEREALELYEIYEDMKLVDKWVGETLLQIQDDLAKYIGDDYLIENHGDVKVDKKVDHNPFSGTREGFKDIFGGLVKNPFKSPEQKNKDFVEKKLKKVTKGKSESLANLVYTVYKKTHGMLAF